MNLMFAGRAALWMALLVPGLVFGQQPPAWFDGPRPTAQARQAVNLLTEAASHGLQPRDYDAAALGQALQRAAQDPPLDPAATARLQQHLTDAMLRYLTDLNAGRVAAQDLRHGYSAPLRKPFDAAAALHDAVEQDRLPELFSGSAPRLAQYEQLRTALARYRALADEPSWKTPLPPVPRSPAAGPPKLEPGGSYLGLSQLRDRLIALGDLPPAAPTSDVYEGALVEAVKSFQQRHGLNVDGVIGRSTLAQLQVPPSVRVRQIELSLERLRWTPLLQSSRMIVINIPEFVLRAYEVQGDRIFVRETIKIVVGKSMDTRTPIFEEQMRFIEFQPYWNVPPSIARGEVVPRLRRDPGYFSREEFEFVTSSGRVVTALSPALLDDVRAGKARIRQRPGPRNALGDIKFVFPNPDNIYLHHTPSVRLFERDRRDFSHGCIRVEQPVALAVFALQGMPEWTEARIRQAMTEGNPSTVRLAQPIPVVIAYATAIVKQGRIHFFDDIYGHDRALDTALRQPRPPLTIRL